MNPLAIEGHLTLVLIQWMVIIAAARLCAGLGWRFGQPLAVGEIAAGILLGPSALGALWPAGWPPLFPDETQTSLQLLGKLGIVFLLFQVGMEFDYSHLRARSPSVAAVSLVGLIAPILAGLAIAPWLHQRFAPQTPLFGFGFFFCIALCISSLPVMGRILLEMNLERTPLGAVAISISAIDDAVGWVLLGVATALVTSRFSPARLLLQLGGLAGFCWLLQRFVGPLLRAFWRRSAGRAGAQTMPASFVAVLMLALFTSCLVTHALGVFTIFGAFVLGVSLHQETSLVKAWRDSFSGVIFVAFVPIFFTNTGLRTRIGSLQTAEAWLACALILAAAVAGKLGGCYLAARGTGQPRREAGCIAALLNTRALMGLVAINIGLDLGLLTPPLFTMLVIMAVVTTAMCGPLLRLWLPPDLRSRLS
jgi:Kef-type K+ transport system membrane component KefB